MSPVSLYCLWWTETLGSVRFCQWPVDGSGPGGGVLLLWGAFWSSPVCALRETTEKRPRAPPQQTMNRRDERGPISPYMCCSASCGGRGER